MIDEQPNTADESSEPATGKVLEKPLVDSALPVKVTEYDGPQGPEPTRFGDWERKGRCIDF